MCVSGSHAAFLHREMTVLAHLPFPTHAVIHLLPLISPPLISLPLVPDDTCEEVSGQLGWRGVGMFRECPTTVVETHLHLEHVIAGRVRGKEREQVTSTYLRTEVGFKHNT